jgi:uroporphyrinogen decarboxylase
MNSRERVLAVLAGEVPDRCPIDFQCTGTMRKRIIEAIGLADGEVLLRRFGSDFRPVGARPHARYIGGYYGHLFTTQIDQDTYVDNWGIAWRRAPMPSGDIFYDVVDSPLKRAEGVSDVEAHSFPSAAEDWDYSGIRQRAEQLAGYAVTGSTSAVFDDAWRLLGFENMLLAMHTNPDMVDAVLRKVCDSWREHARLTLEAAGGAIDLMWTRDDLGTQNGLLMSPAACRRFVIPLIRERVDLFRQYGAGAMMHCCGGIAPIVGDLVEAGVQVLNPIQSAAHGMDRAALKEAYGDRLAFHGSVDEQRVLVPGTPDDVVRETKECIDVLGKGGGYIVASSHELEADIPVENVVAMFDTALEYGRYD